MEGKEYFILFYKKYADSLSLIWMKEGGLILDERYLIINIGIK